MTTSRQGRRLRNMITRRIHFFRWSLDDVDKQAGKDFEPIQLLRQIPSPPFNSATDYLPLGDDRDLCIWSFGSVPHVRIRMGAVRRSGLPQIEDRGALSPLNIQPRQGLAESTHLVFFADSILGAEFNFYGPRVSALTSFIRQRLHASLAVPQFDILLRGDALQQLNRLGSIQLLDISVQRSHLDLVDRAQASLGAGLRACAEALGGDKLEIRLSEPARSGRSLGGAMGFLRTLLGDQRSHTQLDTLKVRGRNRNSGSLEDLDLLQDQLVAAKQVIRSDNRTRGVDSEQMFSAIETAYDELHEDLLRAPGMS